MSSHHVIRDEQEPPILVFQLNKNWEELSDLLGWSPTVVINPELSDLFDSKQTKFDGYLSAEEVNNGRNESDFIYDSSNLSVSLIEWVVHKKYTAINIFCNYNLMKSIFREMKDLSLPIPIIFFTENGKFTLIPSQKFKKWYPSNYKINILNDDLEKVENLVKDEAAYNVEEDGFIKIQIAGNILLIKE